MKTDRLLRNAVRSYYDSNLNLTLGDVQRQFPELTIAQIKKILMSEWE